MLCFVPYFGPMVTMGLLLLAEMSAFDSFAELVAPSAASLGLHLIESNVVSPWLVGRRLSLSPISVFVSVIFWGWI